MDTQILVRTAEQPRTPWTTGKSAHDLLRTGGAALVGIASAVAIIATETGIGFDSARLETAPGAFDNARHSVAVANAGDRPGQSTAQALLGAKHEFATSR